LRRNCLLQQLIERKITGGGGGGWTLQEDEEEDVENHWMTLRKGEDTLF
jgi:hypothetical protein